MYKTVRYWKSIASTYSSTSITRYATRTHTHTHTRTHTCSEQWTPLAVTLSNSFDLDLFIECSYCSRLRQQWQFCPTEGSHYKRGQLHPLSAVLCSASLAASGASPWTGLPLDSSHPGHGHLVPGHVDTIRSLGYHIYCGTWTESVRDEHRIHCGDRVRQNVHIHEPSHLHLF